MSSQSQSAQFLMNAQRVRVGLILAAVGTLIGAIGSIIAGFEMAQATKNWFAESGSSEMALNKAHQALHASRAARHAAREAWIHNGDFVGVEGSGRA